MRAAWIVLGSVVLAGCSGPAPCVGTLCQDDDAGPPDAGDTNAVVGLRVEPATLTLEVEGEAVARGRYRAFFIEADGDERPATGVEWSVGRRGWAEIDASGEVTTSAQRGGEATVIAHVDASGAGASASATLHVRVVRRFGDDARFDAAPEVDASAAPTLLYPLDGAVMPRNLRPPVVQWRPMRGDGDAYRVTLETPHARVVAHVVDPSAHAWAPDDAAWRTLLESDPDEPIAITVDRWQASRERVVAGASAVHLRVARGVVAGQVYYWSLDAGRVMAIDPVTASARDVVPSPPPQPDGHRCIACHTVSRDGRWLWARRFDDGAGFVVDLAEDTTTDPPPMRYAPRGGIDTAAFDPTGELLLAASEGALFVVDASTGLPLPSDGLPTAHASMPAWSPSGERVAWIASTDPADPAAPTSLRLARRVGIDPLVFDDPVTLHEGAVATPEGGSVDALPSFTPDDRFVVFQHGPQAFTSGVLEPRGALHMVATDGSGAARLAALSDDGEAFWPTVSPYLTTEANGRRYYWIAFHSRRDYGNALAGTWGRRTRQLWVAAVDADPAPGVDPSFAPVWLPGQDLRTDNVAAYWAPESCRAPGQACVDDGECCGGACVEGPDGRVCALPPE